MAEEKKGAEKKAKTKTPTAVKRHKQSLKARLHNRSFKAKVRTAINAFDEAVSKGDKAAIQSRLNGVYSLMDKGVKTGNYKLNKAARTKSRLASKI